MPLITGAISSSSLQTTDCGPVEISPMPTMPSSVRTSTSVSSTRRVISCAVQRTRSAGMPIGMHQDVRDFHASCLLSRRLHVPSDVLLRDVKAPRPLEGLIGSRPFRGVIGAEVSVARGQLKRYAAIRSRGPLQHILSAS